MKTKVMLSMAALALVFSNCSNEELENAASQKVTSIKATIEQPVIARSTVDNTTGKFAWVEGDQISVYTNTSDPNDPIGNTSRFETFTYNKANDKFEKVNSGTPQNGYAYYPAAKYHSNVRFNLPTVYKLGDVLENTNAPMRAEINTADPSNLEFKHLGGVILFTIKNAPANANKLLFYADKRVTGNFNTKNLDQISTDSESGNKVEIQFNKKNTISDLKFYVPVPTGTFASLKIQLLNGTAVLLEKTTTNPNTVNRGTLLVMPPVEVPAAQ